MRAATPDAEPTPRYAHQLIYDATTHTHYLFGGNPGKAAANNVRLNDFWQLSVWTIDQSVDSIRSIE